MPELVEVENYRHLLLPLISQEGTLSVECPSDIPPKVFPSSGQLDIVPQCVIKSIERKGKLIRLNLKKRVATRGTNCANSEKKADEFHLYMHMGMTGRISTTDHVPNLESLSHNDNFPPPHTHLILRMNRENNDVMNSSTPNDGGRVNKQTGDSETSTNDISNSSSRKSSYEIAYSDPRRFGAIGLSYHDISSSSTCSQDVDLSICPLEKQWNELAPDALDPSCLFHKLINQKKGIKAILLDQKHVVSGVGNWIADEVLYQTKIHPDQNYLLRDEVTSIESTLKRILTTGIKCLQDNENFPEDWIFHSRWRKSTSPIEDYHGNSVSFVKSAGRTSAIVSKIQIKVKRHLMKNSNDDSIKSKKTRIEESESNNVDHEKKGHDATSKKRLETCTAKKKRSIMKSNGSAKDPKVVVKRRSQRIARLEK